MRAKFSWRVLSGALIATAAIAFLALPLADYPPYEVDNGFEIAAGRAYESDGRGAALVFLASTGVALMLLALRRRGAGIAAVVATIALLAVVVRLVSEQDSEVFDLRFGIFLTVLCMVAADAALVVLALGDDLDAESR